MKTDRLARRRLTNGLVVTGSTVAALAGLGVLGWILLDLVRKGMGAVDIAFFTKLPTPPGMEGGGLGNAVLGTLLMTALAALIAIPTGIAGGTYLAEFGSESRFGALVRMLADILVSAPSIVVGVFVYLLLVESTGHFSGWAGALALAIIMLPVVVRTTEEMLKLVPAELREASLALGAPYWKTVVQVVFRAAAPGMITGIMLAVARVAGETAPLLFTALNSPYWMRGMNEPMANLTVTLFNYAMSPYDDWHDLAWAAALVITVSVLLATLLTRFVLRLWRSS